MEITRKNYFDLLPNIKKAISEAEFLAIDLEFTGLSSAGRDLEDKPFDTPRQYYEKLFQRALDFLPLQLGLCIFKKDSDGERFTYDAYNFYSYPFSDLKGFPDITFQCQSSSLAFLSSFGFDFNKTIREGIPFLTQPQEDNLKASIEERQKKMVKDVKDLVDISVPDDLKTQFDRNIIKIKEFLEDSAGLGENCLTLERCNGLMRRLLFQEVPKEFGDAVHLETCDKSNYAMKVMRGGGEDQKKVREENKIKGEWEAFDKAIGLSHLIKEISKSGKLIIGHNALLDICHLVNRFRYPLPFNYDSFKEMVHLIFPRIIDTKFMCTAPEFKNLISSGPLGQLRDTLLEAPFQMPLIEGNVKEYSYCDLVDKSHEGAYDAYISGQCFLAMCQYLAKSEGKKFDNTDCIKDILSRFENRLFLMRVQDVPYITLGGPDPKPPRNHVFHLQFPQEWRHSEIAELFKPFGSVFVSFIDNQSAFVALQRKDQAKVVLKKLTGNDDYKITSFNAYQKQFERISPPPTKPASPSLAVLRKRKLRESADTPELPSVFKKHCVPEQRRRNTSCTAPASPPRSVESAPRRRSNNSIDLKLSVMRRAACGEDLKSIALEANVNIKTVRRWCQSSEARLELEAVDMKNFKNLKASQFPDLDRALYEWFVYECLQNHNLTGVKIMERAKLLNAELGGPSSFKATSEWLQCFLRRQGIRSLSMVGMFGNGAAVEEADEANMASYGM